MSSVAGGSSDKLSASPGTTSEEQQAHSACLNLDTIPAQLKFSDAVSCLARIIEVFPQLESETGAALNCTRLRATIPAVLKPAHLMNHLMEKVLEAGYAHKGSLKFPEHLF